MPAERPPIDFREASRGTHWEHPCQSCSHVNSTSFVHEGSKQKMDVYSCSDHTKPGLYGTDGTRFPGARIVVRYGPASRETLGEISYAKDSLDVTRLRSNAKDQKARSHLTAPEIAMGKVL